MFLRKILILFIACGCLELSSACADFNPSISQCRDIFNVFHSCASQFLEVSMDHANPFTVCTNESSYRTYINMKDFFDLLSTTSDPKNNNIICSDEYLNKNQQSVILTILNTANEIWESANCDDCYNGSASAKNQTFSDHTIELQKIHANYSNCTRTSKDICQNCQHIYLELNTEFDHQKKMNADKICFDLEDIMNKTRQEWSGIYKCCKDKKDSLTAFFSLFSTVILIAVVFYGVVYITGLRYPATDLLDAQQISSNSTVIPSVRTTLTPSSSSATSSSSQRPSKFK